MQIRPEKKKLTYQTESFWIDQANEPNQNLYVTHARRVDAILSYEYDL